jgi:phosphohistidine phosphatase
MKTLLLMRHAKASAGLEGQADHGRALNERGERDAPRLGQWLRREGLVPDLVISSDAKRAAQTAAAVIDASGCGGEWQQAPGLYEADTEAYFEALRAVPDAVATVLVVAHNPGTEAMVTALTGEEETLPTAAVAQISLPLDHWPDLSPAVEGKLERVVRPRELE